MRVAVFNIGVILALVWPQKSLQGNVGLLRGYTLSPTQSLVSRTISQCACSSKCFEDPTCLGHSIKRSATVDDWGCELFTATTPDSKFTLVPAPRDTFFRSSKTPIGRLGTDGLFYFAPTGLVTSYDDAKALCASFPGYYLAIVKTNATLEIASAHCTNCPTGFPLTLVDLRRLAGGVLEHGDGTTVTDEFLPKILIDNYEGEGSDFFVIYDGMLNDHELGSSRFGTNSKRACSQCRGLYVNKA